MQKILGKSLTRTLSIVSRIFKKNLFIGMHFVFEVTPPEFKKINHSVNLSYSILKISPKLFLNPTSSSKIK